VIQGAFHFEDRSVLQSNISITGQKYQELLHLSSGRYDGRMFFYKACKKPKLPGGTPSSIILLISVMSSIPNAPRRLATPRMTGVKRTPANRNLFAELKRASNLEVHFSISVPLILVWNVGDAIDGAQPPGAIQSHDHQCR
jgi:hypothetical protein